MRVLSVGTRKSELALTQTNLVIDFLRQVDPDLKVTIEEFVTTGDKNLDVSLSKIGGKGLFVKEIEQALLDGKIDFAVHSMKDMPEELPKGLTVGAVPQREDPRDCLVSCSDTPLADLPPGATIGTSSLRRQSQILRLRPDVEVKPIRGNIGTRLRKLKEGHFDAVVLAVAGLNRMNLHDEITEIFSLEQMLPAVGQGALAVQCREDDRDMLSLLEQMNHQGTSSAVAVERVFLQKFQGGCHSPIAAFSRVAGSTVYLEGFVGRSDGVEIIRDAVHGDDGTEVAASLADSMMKKGAKQLLARDGVK